MVLLQAAVQADDETVAWLRASGLDSSAIEMLADPAKGFSKTAFRLATPDSIQGAFPRLPPGQMIILEAAITSLKQAQQVAA